ncbi:MAG: hypothetical protein ACI3U2_10600 [Anaerovibrio sp.]
MKQVWRTQAFQPVNVRQIYSFMAMLDGNKEALGNVQRKFSGHYR